MNTKIINMLLVITLLLSSAGCGGTWRRKFVRRKKGEEVAAPVLQPQDYEKEFTHKQSYSNHFAFWKNSESELITTIKANKSRKRIELFAAYSLDELKEMYVLLIEEKQKELDPYVKELNEIVGRIRMPGHLGSNKNVIVRDLSAHYRAVGKFSYFFMQNYIRPDENGVADTQKDEVDAESIK